MSRLVVSVRIFIPGQDPRSLCTVELDNWTGVAITGQPEFFKKALEAEVLSRSCVYLLIRSSAKDDLPEIYVGESDDFSPHYTSGELPIGFDTFLIFTSKDDNLTRAHVIGLSANSGLSSKAIAVRSWWRIPISRRALIFLAQTSRRCGPISAT